MTAWREMDLTQKWAFGLRFTAFIPLLIGLRYCLLWADPKFGLPRLDFLPSPFEDYAHYIVLSSLILGYPPVILALHIERKRFMKRMWKEYEDEKAEDEHRLR